MASGKTFALFCVFFAFAASTEAASVKATLPQLIQDTITAVTQMVQQVCTLGDSYINQFSTDASGIENTAVAILTSILELIEDNMDTKVAELGDSLDANGLILYNCFVTNRNESNAHLLSFFKAFFDIANPDLINIVSKVTPILDSLKTTAQNVADVSVGLGDCSETDIPCLLPYFAGILNELLQIRVNLAPLIQDVKDTAAAAAPALADSAAQAKNEWYRQNFVGLGVLQQCSISARR